MINPPSEFCAVCVTTLQKKKPLLSQSLHLHSSKICISFYISLTRISGHCLIITPDDELSLGERIARVRQLVKKNKEASWKAEQFVSIKVKIKLRDGSFSTTEMSKNTKILKCEYFWILSKRSDIYEGWTHISLLHSALKAHPLETLTSHTGEGKWLIGNNLDIFT